MKFVTFVLALLPLPALAQEAQDLLCEIEAAGNQQPFGLRLHAPSVWGQPVHCVEAPGLREVLIPCAPQGGWGLTAPDRLDDLTGVATEPREVAGQPGGKFFAFVGPSQFVASASLGERIPLALEVDDQTFWRIQLTLETGQGVVETRDEGERRVSCRPL